jgi:hypothetical protein
MDVRIISIVKLLYISKHSTLGLIVLSENSTADEFISGRITA